MNQLALVLDYETRSEAELRDVGAWEYARHPSTRVLCAAWRFGTLSRLSELPTESWRAFEGEPMPKQLKAALTNPDVQVIAHNAGFENVITRHVLGIKVPLYRWHCTAAMSAALALPRSLEGACDALELPIRKDKEGKLLVRRHCKPRKPTKKNPSRWNDDPEGLERLLDYCRTDVEAEVGLYLNLPPLHPVERKVWQLDQRMNLRGITVDRPLVKSVLALIDQETERLDAETVTLTGGKLESTRKRAQLLTYVNRIADGFHLNNLQAKTVADALACGMVSGTARRLLEIRQAISKTSTAKYLSFDERTASDGRLRDLLIYHGASTGRSTLR